MNEWDGKCSVCGKQIEGVEGEIAYFEIMGDNFPASCKKCYYEETGGEGPRILNLLERLQSRGRNAHIQKEDTDEE